MLACLSASLLYLWLGSAIYKTTSSLPFEKTLEGWLGVQHETSMLKHASNEGIGETIVLAFGSVFTTIVLVFALLIVCRRSQHRLVGWWCAVAWLATEFLVEFVSKPIFLRLRGGWYAFPSGHTARATTVAICAVVVAFTVKKTSRIALTFALATLFAVAQGVAVVSAGWHFAYDAIGAWLLSIAICSGFGVGLLSVKTQRVDDSQSLFR